VSVIAGLQDFRQEGPPADIGTFQLPCSVLVFQHVFNGTTYVCAVRSGVRGWILVDYDTDAATVIQQAMDNLVDGGKIFIRRGIYEISSKLSVPYDGIVIQGEGRGDMNVGATKGTKATVLRATADITVLEIPDRQGCLVRDLEIDCDGIASVGIHTWGFQNFIRHIHVRDALTYGIRIGNGGTGHAQHITDSMISMNATGIGLYADESDNIIKGNIIRGATNGYIYLNGSSGNQIVANHMSRHPAGASQVTDGIVLEDSSGNQISLNFIENVGAGPQIRLIANTAGQIYNKITNNYFNCPNLTADLTYSVIKFERTEPYVHARDMIANNIVNGGGSTRRFSYFIEGGGIATGFTITNNFLYWTNEIYDSRPTNSIIKCIFIDWKFTENSGTATIANGNTSVTFAHGLAGTPTVVVLGATHSEVADAIWSADATNITITVPNPVSADRDISWYAEYKP